MSWFRMLRKEVPLSRHQKKATGKMLVRSWSSSHRYSPQPVLEQSNLLQRSRLPVARSHLQIQDWPAALGSSLLALVVQCHREVEGPSSHSVLRLWTPGEAVPLRAWWLQCFLLIRRSHGTQGWQVWLVGLKPKGRSRPQKAAVSQTRAIQDQHHNKASVHPQLPGIRFPEQKLLRSPNKHLDSVICLPQLGMRVTRELLRWKVVQNPTVKEVKVTSISRTKTIVR